MNKDPKSRRLEVVNLEARRAVRARTKCVACTYEVPSEDAWDIGAGEDSGLLTCPQCNELQGATLLSSIVTETEGGISIEISREFIYQLDERFDPESDLDFGVLLANTFRPYIVDLLDGEPSCLFRE